MIGGEDMPRRLPVHVLEDWDRNRNVRYYVRIRGKLKKKVRIKGTPWTPEFMEQYERAIAGEPADTRPITKPTEGTWRWLCQQYFGSAKFRLLGERTQRIRRQILEHTFDEPIKTGSPHTFANCPIERMTRKAITVLRDRKVEVPESANGRLKAIRAVFDWGKKERDDVVLIDPARDVDYFRVGSDGFYTWTIDDMRQYLERHGPGTKARLAFCILLFSGVRRANVVQLGRQHVRDGKIRFQIQKRKGSANPKWLTIPVLPMLQAEMDLAPKDNLTFLTTEFGKAFTSNGFGNWFKKRCREAGLPQCSAHGLRKGGATIAAENGASDAQLQAMFGWDTQKEAARYRKKAEQRRLAADAMPLIRIPDASPESGTDSEQNEANPGPTLDPSGTFQPKRIGKSKPN